MAMKILPRNLYVRKAISPFFFILLLAACLNIPATTTVTPFVLPSRTSLPTTSTLPIVIPTSGPAVTQELFSRYASLPSGQYIVYGAEGGLYVISVDGQIHEKLTDLSGDSISPDGTRIYDDAIYNLVTNQVFSDPVPPNICCLVRSGSPDGAMLALECWDDYEVYALSIQDGNLVRLSYHLGLGEEEANFAPMWSPDGKWIAYFKMRPAPPERKREIIVSELYLADAGCIAEPETCVAKTRGPFRARFFKSFGPYGWSPDSRYLAIPGFDVGTILIVDIYKNEIKPLMVKGYGSVDATAWSLDGKWIAYSQFESEQNRTDQIFIVPAEGGEPIRLTSGADDKVVMFWLRVP